MSEALFIILIFTIATLYSSVGHGGASGYLALMAIFGFAPEFMKPTALVLNIFVSGTAFYAYYRKGYLRFPLLWPFIITSIPFAFLGGSIHINPVIYKMVLGVFLLFAIGKMLIKPTSTGKNKKPVNIYLALTIGAALGFISGLIGIGGGIILSPLIILLAWGNLKEIATVSAAFILVNSVAGLSGLMFTGVIPKSETFYLVFVGVAGAIIGSLLGSITLSEKKLRYVLSAVLLFASFKLLVL